jgi:TRAP transporter TAXI family solute receptor
VVSIQLPLLLRSSQGIDSEHRYFDATVMKRLLPIKATELITFWIPLSVLVLFGFLIAYRYVGAPPPREVRIATGMADGAYLEFAQRYADLLARDGVTLRVVPTAGAVENLQMLRRGDVTLAIVQGGVATEEDRNQLQSLGSLFLEPVWVFTRDNSPADRLSALSGKRIAIGASGSGTNRLATQLLAANGVSDSDGAALIPMNSAEASNSLSNGEVDAALFVASPEAPVIRDLVRTPGLKLLDWQRTTAYDRLFSYLAPVTLAEGVLDLRRNIPSHDMRLVATTATLAARDDINPSLIPALLNAVTRVHERGGVLEARRQFPSVDFADLPVNEDAARYIRNGPSFLYRWLPYRTAVLIDRLKILSLPLFALLLPIIRIAPPFYQWRIRSRIYRWYAAVREIDMMILSGNVNDPDSVRTRLQALERDVASVSVPLAYAGEQYHLRLHIHLLQERLDRVAASGPRVNSGEVVGSRLPGR